MEGGESIAVLEGLADQFSNIGADIDLFDAFDSGDGARRLIELIGRRGVEIDEQFALSLECREATTVATEMGVTDGDSELLGQPEKLVKRR